MRLGSRASEAILAGALAPLAGVLCYYMSTSRQGMVTEQVHANVTTGCNWWVALAERPEHRLHSPPSKALQGSSEGRLVYQDFNTCCTALAAGPCPTHYDFYVLQEPH